MGERWSFLILRASLDGIEHFEEFQAVLGIARNILANRLSRLVAKGIMSREPMAQDKRRVTYRLTPKGRDLLPAMIALRQWGERWGGGPPCNRVLADRRDHAPVRAIGIQAQDGRALALDDLCWIGRVDDERE
jgi:DNA-binding HxlR family transcriptional regulator